jgi:putative transposase
MPDHLHALVGATTDEADFRPFIKIAKQRSSYYFAQTHGERLWRPSFFDRTLRPNQDPIDVMRYIVMNPVRAGIARDPREYEFWGSESYGREELLEYVGGDPTHVPWT